MHSETEKQLVLEYELRFARLEKYRAKVWAVLCKSFFQRFIKNDNTILDLGCGWGEFINAIQAGKKYAMDLNPGIAETSEYGRSVYSSRLFDKMAVRGWIAGRHFHEQFFRASAVER